MPCSGRRSRRANRVLRRAASGTCRAVALIVATNAVIVAVNAPRRLCPDAAAYFRGRSGTENSMLVSPVRRFSKSVTESRNV